MQKYLIGIWEKTDDGGGGGKQGEGKISSA